MSMCECVIQVGDDSDSVTDRISLHSYVVFFIPRSLHV